MVTVNIEGRELLVPRANIVGHFRKDITLQILQQCGRNTARALQHLLESPPVYQPDMHSSLKAMKQLPQLRAAAAKAAQDLLKKPNSFNKSCDGNDDAPLDLHTVRKNRGSVRGEHPPNKKFPAQAAVELVLRCPPVKKTAVPEPLEAVIHVAGEASEERKKLMPARLQFLRALLVCLLPEQRAAFEAALHTIIAQHPTQDAQDVAITAALSGYPGMSDLFSTKVVEPRLVLREKKQQPASTKRRSSRLAEL
eukprot:TRINITY_DN874_c0_g1_i1.p2 TRINITY_DN874_c0_g1~~TRINITY_DN874_c0_g1_i1.p2  ORF type:complete len:252 (-),score=68.57 TRINITY_DN874_c0_g1_i1:308-1063(-)